jgi:aspartate 1-decarboxylase
LINSGDLVILCTYVVLNGEEVKEHVPKIVHVNSDNEIVQI